MSARERRELERQAQSLDVGFFPPPESDDSRDLRVELPDELNRPTVGSSFDTKSSKLEPVDTQDVIQYKGPTAREFSITGACFPGDSYKIEQYTTVPAMMVRLPHRGTLRVMVQSGSIDNTLTLYENVDNEHAQADDSGTTNTSEAYLQDFQLDVIETAPPDSNGGDG